jgi:signal transduction histidine kinase
MQQARAEVVNAWQRLHDLFMQAPANIAILRGPHLRFELANPPYLKTSDRSDVLGKAVREVFPEEERQQFMHQLDQVYATGVPFAGKEVWAQLQSPEDGTLKEGYFNYVFQPTRDLQGKVDGILIHGVEVTEQVRARQRMDTFLGIASHELRTPLTVIKGSLQLARWHAEDAENQYNGHASKAGDGMDPLLRLLGHAEQQVNRLVRLVDDLTEVSRFHSNMVEMRMQICDLCSIVRQIVEEQRALAPTRTIQLELASTCVLLVKADADRLCQVVTNYLSNALKYSPEEQPIEVTIVHQDREVRVLVRDRGYGLTLQQQERIWERFHRVEGINVQSGSSVGLGLGLYISRMIIEQHQGRVGVESAPGEGSTFWFALPSLEVEEEESASA